MLEQPLSFFGNIAQLGITILFGLLGLTYYIVKGWDLATFDSEVAVTFLAVTIGALFLSIYLFFFADLNWLGRIKWLNKISPKISVIHQLH